MLEFWPDYSGRGPRGSPADPIYGDLDRSITNPGPCVRTKRSGHAPANRNGALTRFAAARLTARGDDTDRDIDDAHRYITITDRYTTFGVSVRDVIANSAKC